MKNNNFLNLIYQYYFVDERFSRNCGKTAEKR